MCVCVFYRVCSIAHWPRARLACTCGVDSLCNMGCCCCFTCCTCALAWLTRTDRRVCTSLMSEFIGSRRRRAEGICLEDLSALLQNYMLSGSSVCVFYALEILIHTCASTRSHTHKHMHTLNISICPEGKIYARKHIVCVCVGIVCT